MKSSTSSSAKATSPGKSAPAEAAEHTPAEPVPNPVPIRFRLTGPAAPVDSAHQAIRGDLADIAEAARHFAPHYALPVMRTVADPAALLAAPDGDAAPIVMLAAGDEFALLDETGGWAWGYRIADHRVGYLPASQLVADA